MIETVVYNADRLAQRVVLDAMYNADEGNVLDMFWLVSDEAEHWIDATGIVDREDVVRIAAKAMSGERKFLPPKKQIMTLLQKRRKPKRKD